MYDLPEPSKVRTQMRILLHTLHELGADTVVYMALYKGKAVAAGLDREDTVAMALILLNNGSAFTKDEWNSLGHIKEDEWYTEAHLTVESSILWP